MTEPTNREILEAVRGMRIELAGMIREALDVRTKEVELLRETVSKDITRLDRKNRDQDARLEALERRIEDIEARASTVTIPPLPPFDGPE
jgi:cell division septum initiation protein DivIVA